MNNGLLIEAKPNLSNVKKRDIPLTLFAPAGVVEKKKRLKKRFHYEKRGRRGAER
jgi:hypothetical protein